MPVNGGFIGNTLLYAANLNSTFSQAANIAGDAFTGPVSIQGIDIGSGLQNAYNKANGAFATANTGSSVTAQFAYTQANAAFIQANAAFAAANAGGGSSGAYNTANAAFIAANTNASMLANVYNEANAVYTLSNNQTVSINAVFVLANTNASMLANVYNEANAVFVLANTNTSMLANVYNEANAAFASSNSNAITIAAAFNKANSGSNAILVRNLRTITVANTTSCNVSNTDSVIIVNQTTPGPVSIYLQKYANSGFTITLKDGRGDANTNNITLIANSNYIDSSYNGYVININYMSIDLISDSNNWFLI